MTLQRWTRRRLRQISARLEQLGHAISPPTVGRLLTVMDYALRVNTKKREAGEGHPDRDAPFTHIAQQRERVTKAGLPIISVDTKKKLRHEVARSERARRSEDRPMPAG